MANPRAIVQDIAKALRDVFKKHPSRFMRGKAWKAIISKKGQEEVAKLIVNADRPLSRFKNLSFSEWLEKKSSD